MKNSKQLSQTLVQQFFEPNILIVNCEIHPPGFELQSHFPTQYVTPREAAFMLDVNERTIRRWASQGRLKRYRFGHNTTFYKRHELFGD